jgi:hypothetical protein
VGQSWDRCREHRAKALERDPLSGLPAAASERSTGSGRSSECKYCDESPKRPPRPKRGHARNDRRRPEERMTSPRQIEANRRNALQSTGPTSANGKHVSRRNALRHGFTAETVLEPLENPEEYWTFEAAILSEYLPQTPIEQELVRRLASLFWRLRPGNLDRNGPASYAGRDPSRLP